MCAYVRVSVCIRLRVCVYVCVCMTHLHTPTCTHIFDTHTHGRLCHTPPGVSLRVLVKASFKIIPHIAFWDLTQLRRIHANGSLSLSPDSDALQCITQLDISQHAKAGHAKTRQITHLSILSNYNPQALCVIKQLATACQRNRLGIKTDSGKFD